MTLSKKMKILTTLEWHRPDKMHPPEEKKVLIVLEREIPGLRSAYSVEIGQYYRKAWEDSEFNIVKPLLWAHIPDPEKLASNVEHQTAIDRWYEQFKKEML